MSTSRSLPLVVAGLLLLAGAALADYKESYKRGLDAAEKRQWAEAARQMRLAIAEKPEASGALSSTLLRRYVPHFHLGVALANLGDCRNAVDELDVAERQGKMSREEEKELATRRQQCKQRIAQVEEAAAAARREVDAAAASAYKVAGIESSPVMKPVWRQGSPSFASRQEPATSKLAGARDAVARGEQELNAATIAEAGRLAQEARRELDALAADATAKRNELQARVDLELGEMQKAVTGAKKDLAFATRSLGPLPAEVKVHADKLQAVLTEAAEASSSTPIEKLTEIQDRLRKAVRELRAAIKPPPEELQQAAKAYLGGDYAGALTLLETQRPTDPRTAAHTCLLRAAAMHGVYSLQGATDEALLTRTRDELRSCLALKVRAKVVPAAFPPRFLAFYDEVSREPAPAPSP